ncbi:dihydroorotase [Chitinivibrio alkaliphilus]|uniref:Dihydroorotase n=1 Tax=Chitinivibrio alkaliphilus ACht1 TaxID=1313304 RepID=U7DA87_9BACT|nr:dihydroorotase [Chitinivibrio alkaliphilus]ERP32042.1 dihydroorotase [Chitinivibrio alkaliphilus ACht1]
MYNEHTKEVSQRTGKKDAILIRDGRILDPKNNRDEVGDVALLDGKIYAVGTIPSNFTPTVTIDATGKWITPGLIDIHVHLREPGGEHKETIETGTAAAAAGGFTALACMPNTTPVTDTEAKIRYIKQQSRYSPARVYPVGAMSKGLAGEELAPYGEMHKAGACAVSDDGKSVYRSDMLKHAITYAKMFSLPVLCHCEDKDLAAEGAMDESAYSVQRGIPGIPSISEDIDVARHIAIAEYTNTPIHICHVSSAGAVRIIAAAKKRGVPVTAETAAHYLWYTHADVGYDTYKKMNPPLRGPEDQEALLAGLISGSIDLIASDHAPHTIEDKDGGFDTAAFGVVGLETTVGATLPKLVHSQKISPLQWVALHSTTPAEVLHVEGGELSPGTVGDVTLIDPNKEWTVSADAFCTKGQNSAFLGETLHGKAVLTITDGEIVFREK